jgi:hypothetical protein
VHVQTCIVRLSLIAHLHNDTMRSSHCQPIDQCVLSLHVDAAAFALLIASVTASISAAGLMFAGANVTTCRVQ